MHVYDIPEYGYSVYNSVLRWPTLKGPSFATLNYETFQSR